VNLSEEIDIARLDTASPTEQNLWRRKSRCEEPGTPTWLDLRLRSGQACDKPVASTEPFTASAVPIWECILP